MGPMKAAGKLKKKGGNKGVGVDFKRVKHKVGKKLAKAQNDTDVDFRSKAIHMPNQAIQQDKDGLAVNFHNLTLQELLAQTGHYSEKARKHALLGMADLFQRHPEEIRQHAHQFFPKVAERVGDPDQSVRQALRALLREHVMPATRAAALRPFMPVVMAHVSGAMTNLNMEVRLDAINFLDVLMDFTPELITGSFLAPCLHHFCDLLSQAHRGRSIKSQSLSSLLKVLTALNSFLARAFSDRPASTNASSATAAAASMAPPSQQAALRQDRCNWPPRDALQLLEDKLFLRADSAAASAPMAPPSTESAEAAAAALSRQPLYKQQQLRARKQEKDGAAAAAGHAVEGAEKEVLAWRLVGLLFNVWAECAPGQISTAPDLEAVKALGSILSAVSLLITHLLLDTTASGSSRDLSTVISSGRTLSHREMASLAKLSDLMLKQLAPNFPATAPAVKANAELAEAMVKYNLTAAHVMVQLLPGLAHPHSSACGAADPPFTASPVWVDVLIRYLVGVLDHGLLLPTKGMFSEVSSEPLQVAAASYDALLQYVATAVPLVRPAHATTLVSAVSRLGARMHSKSPVRAACVRMQQQLIASYQRGDLLLDDAMVVSWLGDMPKLLWELGSANPELSTVALNMLHGASCCAVPGTPLCASLASMQQKLTPLFCASVPQPKKSSKKQKLGAEGGGIPAAALGADGCAPCAAAASRQVAVAEEAAPMLIAGPLSKSGLQIQNLAIDVLYHLGPLDRSLLRSLLPALHTNVLPDVAALRLAEVIAARLPDTEPAAVLGWLLSVLFSRTVPGTSDDPTGPCSWERRRSIADVICRAIPSWAPASVALQLLGAQLAALLLQQGGALGLSELQSYSLLRLHVAAAAEGADGAALSGKDIPEEVKASVPVALVNLFLMHLARLRCLRRPHDASSPEALLCMDLLKGRPDLVVPVLEACQDRVCGGVKLSSVQGGQGQGGHSASCARATFMSVSLLVQQVLRMQQLRAPLLAQEERVQAAVGALISHGTQDVQLSGDEAVKADGLKLSQAVRHIFSSS